MAIAASATRTNRLPLTGTADRSRLPRRRRGPIPFLCQMERQSARRQRGQVRQTAAPPGV
eukprot:7352817-Pyramimonas_sp.AAC.2